MNKKEKVLSIIRHSLTFAGGLLIMRGYLDAKELQEISGGIITVVGTVWGVVAKNQT